ncbi:AAA domain-containing protein, partial [Blyttiomyces helicus]
NVLFIDTDAVPALESRPGSLVQNEVEVELVFQTIETLIASGVDEAALGIISPYRSQLRLIETRFKHRPGIEILTVDRFQGRDKDCVVASLVRSNGKQKIGELLRDWRRINVAFTRAKRKLIVI